MIKELHLHQIQPYYQSLQHLRLHSAQIEAMSFSAHWWMCAKTTTYGMLNKEFQTPGLMASQSQLIEIWFVTKRPSQLVPHFQSDSGRGAVLIPERLGRHLTNSQCPAQGWDKYISM